MSLEELGRGPELVSSTPEESKTFGLEDVFLEGPT